MPTPPPPPPAFELVPRVMRYAWGKFGTKSLVARFAHHRDPAAINHAAPYAELWMGTHPNAPAAAVLPGCGAPVPLPDLIRAHPHCLLTAHFADLPFLFKVLSVGKALSIQAHPDRALATRLHATQPENYRDDNHKPEMAVALTRFDALYGFRPSDEIRDDLERFPELAVVAGPDAVARFLRSLDSPVADAKQREETRKDGLRALFGAIMRADEETVHTQLTALVARSDVPTLVRRIHDQFPGDVGVFCALLMNHVVLEPGQALYMGANELHAYLSGDCIEVMATSDNVVRAGLTPKLKDVDTLVAMLTYTQASPQDSLLAGVPHPRAPTVTTVYDPPIEEFTVHRHAVAAGTNVQVPVVHGPSVTIVTEGSGTLGGVQVEPGSVVYALPGAEVAVEAGAEALVAYQAFCEAPRAKH